jgi:hypothetical protein
MLKRFILWDFPRASWQYDVMVGIILAFIFLTPREWFRDQPRIPNASQIAMLPASEHGSPVAWMETGLLSRIPDDQRAAKATELLRLRTGNRRIVVTRVEPVRDSENEIQGYLAFARP